MWYPNWLLITSLTWPGASFQAASSKAGTNCPLGPTGRYPWSFLLPSALTSAASFPKSAPALILASACWIVRWAAAVSAAVVPPGTAMMCWKTRAVPSL